MEQQIEQLIKSESQYLVSRTLDYMLVYTNHLSGYVVKYNGKVALAIDSSLSNFDFLHARDDDTLNRRASDWVSKKPARKAIALTSMHRWGNEDVNPP